MIIRRAKTSELKDLKEFYNANWGYCHPLINVKAFVEFYFTDGAHLNFIIARESEASEIISACGYILANSTANSDAWTSLWLSKKGANTNTGLQILNYMATEMGLRLLASSGINPDTKVFYHFLGYHTAKMEQYYRLVKKEAYDVAIIKKLTILPVEKTACMLKLFKNEKELTDSFDVSKSMENRPYKDLAYITKRYYHFPYLQYLVFGVINEQKKCHSLLVVRKADVNGASVLRIVDFIGVYEELSKIGHCIDDLLHTYESEYADLYCYGLDPELLHHAGFVKRNDQDGNVIPFYLDPYLPKNIDKHLFCNNIDDFVMFKADGDQDRLNIELI